MERLSSPPASTRTSDLSLGLRPGPEERHRSRSTHGTAADLQRFAGFSSDLYISTKTRSLQHDGPANAFYQTLKRGEPYRGYYATPFHEIVAIYQQLRSSTD